MGEEMEVTTGDGEAVISSAEQAEKTAVQPPAEHAAADSAPPSQSGAGVEAAEDGDAGKDVPSGESAGQDADADADADKDKEADDEAAGEDKGEGGEKAEGGAEGGAEGAEAEEKEEAGSVNFPLARVKRIMRKNPDKKKNFGQPSVHAIATIAELFVSDIAKAAYQFTVERKRKTMQLPDIGDSIKAFPRFEFLDAPGILPDVTQAQKRAKPAPPAAAAAAAAAEPQSAGATEAAGNHAEANAFAEEAKGAAQRADADADASAAAEPSGDTKMGDASQGAEAAVAEVPAAAS